MTQRSEQIASLLQRLPPPVAGVDEAGRGCLAGPVVAAAVILPQDISPEMGLKDSKKLSAAKRSQLEQAIKHMAMAWSLGLAWPPEIDRINILQATLRAMHRAVTKLRISPGGLAVDGNQGPDLALPCSCLPGGDGMVPAISAASILAKTFRDRLMQHLHRRYPGYGFDLHKGYGTKAHVQRLQELGPCRMHRRSFKPVGQALTGRQQWLPGI